LIAQSTQELVQCAKQLKGADLIDPDDPTYIAENELFNAAQSIELAAKKNYQFLNHVENLKKSMKILILMNKFLKQLNR